VTDQMPVTGPRGTPMTDPHGKQVETTRRAVLAGAGAVGLTVALAGCAAYGDTGPAAKPEGTGGAGQVLIKTSGVPVGGGAIVDQVVVTQPVQGTFKCFSAICTHAGCPVNKISGGEIHCPCHGSAYKIADGSVANGPATKPLPPVDITVTGDDITLTH
jgi:Rieske Fe-S protein